MESSKFQQTPKNLSTEKVQDAQIGLLEWEMEEREKQHAAQIEASKKENGTDHLTGANSRRVFDQELAQSLKMIRGEVQEKRVGSEALREVSLILMDVDHFKGVNDTFGHPVGDEVLRKVSAVLMESIRDTDMVARWGGEEFFVVLRNMDIRRAEEKAEEFRVKIAKLLFADNPTLRVTASFGVISSDTSTDPKTLETLVDKTLYKAKEGGRNRVETYK